MWKCRECGGEVLFNEITNKQYKIEKDLGEGKFVSNGIRKEQNYWACKECDNSLYTKYDLEEIARWEE